MSLVGYLAVFSLLGSFSFNDGSPSPLPFHPVGESVSGLQSNFFKAYWL